MAAKIICYIQFGVKDQTVYIDNNKYSGKKTLETHKVPMNQLPEFFATQNDADDIYISGGFTAFCKGIEKRTKEIEMEKFNKQTKVFHY